MVFISIALIGPHLALYWLPPKVMVSQDKILDTIHTYVLRHIERPALS